MNEPDTVEELQRPAGELRLRTAELVGVSFPERTIELIVIPYETETLVPHPREQRMITEVISRGAFDGIERRPNRVRVNRDHRLERTVGRALALHPSRDDGLFAEIRIAQTQLGDETLALANEGILDASAGFLPMPGGERWRDRSHCRIDKGWLSHIALTPDPAYETANVLAVRSAAAEQRHERPSTPNFDTVRHRQLEELYADLDRRYSHP